MKHIALLLLLALAAAAQNGTLTPRPSIYIEPQNGFETYISAAFFKKDVPATLTANKDGATMVLVSGQVTEHEEKSGLGKLARCAYAFCIGIDGSQTVSVRIQETATGNIVWAYSVRKGGSVNYQSSAEAIAKHFREFLETQSRIAARAAKAAKNGH
jgi:hypothetical protein